MDYVIQSVKFLPNGDIEVTYKHDSADPPRTHLIPKRAKLRKGLDHVLIDKIKEQLLLLP